MFDFLEISSGREGINQVGIQMYSGGFLGTEKGLGRRKNPSIWCSGGIQMCPTSWSLVALVAMVYSRPVEMDIYSLPFKSGRKGSNILEKEPGSIEWMFLYDVLFSKVSFFQDRSPLGRHLALAVRFQSCYPWAGWVPRRFYSHGMGSFGFMNVQCTISGWLRLKYAWFLKHTTLLGYTMHRYAQCSSVFWISGLSPIFRIFFGTFTIRVVTLRYKTIDLSIFGYDRICRKEPVLERGIYWVLATTEKDRRQRQLGGWWLNLSSCMNFFEIAKSLLMSLIIHTILICHGFPIRPHRLGFLSAGRRAIFASDSQYAIRL